MARNPRIAGGDKTGIQLGSFYNYDVATEAALPRRCSRIGCCNRPGSEQLFDQENTQRSE